MAHSLGTRVVAEGVDEAEQQTVLEKQGCDEMQGFLFSAALPAREFVRFLRRGDPKGGGAPAGAQTASFPTPKRSR
jgi:sensor c-di-GMP phosphodiesterase-like protein